MTHPSADTTDAVLLTVEQAARRLNISRSTAYALIAEGRLASIRIGALRRVPVQALEDFVTAQRQIDGGP